MQGGRKAFFFSTSATLLCGNYRVQTTHLVDLLVAHISEEQLPTDNEIEYEAP